MLQKASYMRRAAENGDWGRDVGALDVSEPDAHPRAARTDCSIQSPASHSMLASLCDPAYRKSFLCCAGAGERGRLSENLLAIMWGWSRRTDGQALKGGGRQQAALKRSGKTRASHGRDSRSFHGGRAGFEDSCGGPTRKILGGDAAGRIKVREACPKG